MKRVFTKYTALYTMVLFGFCISHAQAQTRTITGKVLTVNNEPLPGASIYQKGTTFGTVTDVDGNYSLNVADTAVLVFSSIGYIKQEIKVGAQQIITVQLKEDVVGLEEVIVVGYGEQKRSNVTGAVSSVKLGDMENKTQLRLDQALQGMAAGVTVTRNGGAPGAVPTIHIRGVGSINDTAPLWIVDGIKMQPGNQFNVDDIETVEVLKDASASAIYGAQAAHGVILVTTKRGKGPLNVTYKSSFGKRQPVKLPKLLGTQDFIRLKNQARVNSGVGAVSAWNDFTNTSDPNYTDTDWVDAFYNGDGFIQSHDLSLAKGDDKFNYFLSFGYDTENGILIDNDYKRYGVRFNSDLKVTKWLKIGESTLLSRVVENPIGNNNENWTGGIPYRSIPIMPVYDINNKYGGWGMAPDSFEEYFQGTNPVATQYQQHEKRTSNRIDGNAFAEVTPLDGLLIRGAVGYNFLAYMGERFEEAYDYGNLANPLASLTYSASNDLTLTANLVATYHKTFNKHDFKIMGGYESSQFETKHFNVTGNDFPVDVAWSMNLFKGALSSTDRYNIDQNRWLSQFGRLNYNFDEKYLLEANFRRDASAAKFGPNKLWGFFPSMSVGWRISQENFFKNVPFITNLKLRASTGKLGSDAIPSWVFLPTYTSQFSTMAFDDKGANRAVGFYLSRFTNRDVQWEEVNLNNIAIDLKAFENRFSLSVDYYIKDTKKLLYPVPLPASVGIATHNFDPVSPAVNIGTMRNTGLDIDFGYNFTYRKFSFTFGGNTSFMKNEMRDLNGNSFASGNGGQLQGGMTRTQPGMPVSSFYGYVVQQVLNTNADIYAINSYAKDGLYQEAATAPGDFMYKDISGPDGVPDGEITAQYDRVFIGNPWPKMTYALNINASYDRLVDISIQFQGVQGVDVYNANKAYARNFFGDNNTTTDILDAWTPEHHTNNPRNVWNDPNGNFSKPSTYFVEDGSYLKLRNIQIGFTLPAKILERAKINRLRLFVNANNFLTFTKYSGLDPEIAGGNVSRGIDYGVYPQVRTYSAGLELQF